LSNERRRRRSISSFGKIGDASIKALPRGIAVLKASAPEAMPLSRAEDMCFCSI
jgi:hypothetical protein